MKRNDNQVCLKLPAPLRKALAAEAAARRRSLSDLIRIVLTDHSAERIVARETQAEAA
jgi:hypothetical protein